MTTIWGSPRPAHLIGEAEFTLGRTRRARAALERGLEHARKARDRREEAELLAGSRWRSPRGLRPWPRASPRLDAILADGRGNQRVTSFVTIVKALLVAMQGRFDEARALIGRGQAILEELGLNVRSAMAPAATSVRWSFSRVIRQLQKRRSARVRGTRAHGGEGLLSTLAAWLADALYARRARRGGRCAHQASEAAAAPDDVGSQVGWRSVRAKLLARRRAGMEAERLAREAVALAERTDMLDLRGDALWALAEVLDDSVERASALEQAAVAFEQKGNEVSAARARAARDELQRVSGR